MQKMNIIAHRGAFLPEGPIPKVQVRYEILENTIEAFKRAFENGWGLETDVRLREDGAFVLSHDPNLTRLSSYPNFIPPTLEELCKLARKFEKKGKSPIIAFQIKRSSDPNSGVSVGREVAKKMKQYNFESSILFDATFEEAQILHTEFPWMNLSVSVGEQNYSPTVYTPNQALSDQFTSVFSSVWADEWKVVGSIYTKGVFKKLRAAYSGRIDVISPELHYNEDHPMSKNLEKITRLWEEIISWEIADGICTDYPTVLSSFFN